jgi:hypothetical protein
MRGRYKNMSMLTPMIKNKSKIVAGIDNILPKLSMPVKNENMIG